MPQKSFDPVKNPSGMIARRGKKLKRALLGDGATGLVSLLLEAANDISRDDQKLRAEYIEEKYNFGGKPFVDRVKRYGKTEDGTSLRFDPWLEEFLELLGDFRVGHTITIACSQQSKSLSHVLLCCDIQACGRVVFGYVFDKKQSLTNAQPTQFKPCLDNWIGAMVKDGLTFDRSRDTQSQTRNALGGVNSVFTYASTSDQAQRSAGGKSAVGSGAHSFKADVLVYEEKSQWPLGAGDIFYRRLDYSVIDSKPVRELGTPGSGQGIELEIKGADHHFYPHFKCDECGEVSPLDAFGCLLTPFTRTDAFGQVSQAYVSEANRPVEWFHYDEMNPVDSAYFGCPHCRNEIGESTRRGARFKCKTTGIWLRDYLDSLPAGVPEKRHKCVIHYGPLLRATKINLAADLIRNGLEMMDASDWVQQGLGHPSEAGASTLTMSVLTRAVNAPPAQRKPELRVAGIDQARNGFWTSIMDVSLPENWGEMPVEMVIDRATRQVIFADEVPVNQIETLLNKESVMFGAIDNEPSRTIAGELQRTTNLIMVDQRAGLGDAFRKTTVREGGIDIPCHLIRNEKFMMQAMRGFLLSEIIDGESHPLTRLPDDWTKWFSQATERSPLRHYLGVKNDPLTNKWEKTDEANGLYYALMMSEAALYIWLAQGGGSDSYVPGTLANRLEGTGMLDKVRNPNKRRRMVTPVRRCRR